MGSYRKELTVWHVVFFALGSILGPAIAFAPVYVVALAGPGGIVAWFVALLMIIPLGLVYAELGTTWPRAGGVAYYPSRSNGPLTASVNGWGTFVGYTLTAPLVIYTVIEYLAYYWPTLYTNGTLTFLGIGVSELFVVLFFLLNTARVSRMGDAFNAMTIATVVSLLALTLVLLVYLKPSNFNDPSYGGFLPAGAVGLFSALSLTIFGFGGFRQPIDYSEEVKNPGKDIPRAIVISLVLSAVIFALESVAFVGALSWKAIGISPGQWGELFSLPYPYVSEVVGVGAPLLVILVLFVAIVGSLKNGVIYTGSSARVAYTMAANDEILPEFLTKLNRKGIPLNAVILMLVVTALMIALSQSLSSVISVAVDALLISYAPSCVSLAVFRRSFPSRPRPYKLPAYKVLSPFAFAVASLLVYWTGWSAVRLIIPLNLAGLLLLVFYSRRKALTLSDVKAGIWFPLFLAVTALLSFLGSQMFGGVGVIPFPFDSVLYVAVSLVFYWWGYRSGVKYTSFQSTIGSEEAEGGEPTRGIEART
ncbi:APC family permease [Sulfodiicoccus acidiphilus]|uniref:APC family permease n=1 Tax=Sulfodiicoccus acidiphilus TaxID=1670455 RepID=UPI0013159593|nr:APC family permease [Sulfodiicoccus acidiphilus]